MNQNTYLSMVYLFKLWYILFLHLHFCCCPKAVNNMSVSHTEGKKMTNSSYKIVILRRDVPHMADATLFHLQTFCLTAEEMYNAAQSPLVVIFRKS